MALWLIAGLALARPTPPASPDFLPAMRLGFDVTPLLVPVSGIGTYAKNLLDDLIQAARCRLERVGRDRSRSTC